MILQGLFETIDTEKPFNWKIHKDNFPHYLEVILLPNGEIRYACPDHKNAMEKIAGVTDYDCPPEYWFSMIDWLVELTKCVAVYTDCYRGKLNSKQLASLQMLKEVGVYEGKI